MDKILHFNLKYILQKNLINKDSLGLHPDFPVHDGCSGDTASQRVNFKQPATTRRLDGVGNLTIRTLIHIFSYNLKRDNVIIKVILQHPRVLLNITFYHFQIGKDILDLHEIKIKKNLNNWRIISLCLMHVRYVVLKLKAGQIVIDVLKNQVDSHEGAGSCSFSLHH